MLEAVDLDISYCSLSSVPEVLSDSVFHLFIQSQLSMQEIEESLELGLCAADIVLHSAASPLLNLEQSASNSSLLSYGEEGTVSSSTSSTSR